MSGEVDQSGSMLSDDVAEKGYALLCMAVPQTDCKIMTVSEVSMVFAQSISVLVLVTGCAAEGSAWWWSCRGWPDVAELMPVALC
jgi:hypothetical protein